MKRTLTSLIELPFDLAVNKGVAGSITRLCLFAAGGYILFKYILPFWFPLFGCSLIALILYVFIDSITKQNKDNKAGITSRPSYWAGEWNPTAWNRAK